MNQAVKTKDSDESSEVFRSDELKSEEEIHVAARSNMYALMADVFRYPDDEFRNFVRNGELVDALTDILTKLPFDCSIDDKERNVLTFPDQLKDDDIEAEFIRLFEAGPGDPPCPLVEGKYNKESSRKSIFENLIRFYNHFGLSYQEGSQEDRPDHISFELEFMHYLAFLTLKALQDKKETQGYLLAQKDFLAHHLTRWSSRLVNRMEKIIGEIATPDDVVLFYAALINILDRFIAADFAYLKRALDD